MILADRRPNAPPCSLMHFLRFASLLLKDGLNLDFLMSTSCLRHNFSFLLDGVVQRKLWHTSCHVFDSATSGIPHHYFAGLFLNVFYLFYDLVVPKSLKAFSRGMGTGVNKNVF